MQVIGSLLNRKGKAGAMFCTLCGETCEEIDQPENAALCNACVAYLNARFGPIADDLTDAALDQAFQNALDKND